LRIFKTKSFARFSKKSGLSDLALLEAVKNIEDGLIDADLGGGVIKQRIARDGGGKSSGFRTIILFKIGNKAFFVHGFAKNDLDNISRDDLLALKRIATKMLNYNDVDISREIKDNLLIEVYYG
jgi:hypothetical protein